MPEGRFGMTKRRSCRQSLSALALPPETDPLGGSLLFVDLWRCVPQGDLLPRTPPTLTARVIALEALHICLASNIVNDRGFTVFRPPTSDDSTLRYIASDQCGDLWCYVEGFTG